MKLLIFSSETYPTYGGDGLSAYRFASRLQEYCETSILSYSRNSTFNKIENIDGIRIFRTSYFGASYISKAISRFKLVNLAWKIGKHYNVWLIYGLLPSATLLVVLAKLLGRKVIFRPTLAGFDTLDEQNLSKLSMRVIYSFADGFFIRNSKMLSDKHSKNKKLFFSSQGVQLDRFRCDEKPKKSLRYKYGISENTIAILMVGHLCKRKGFPEIAHWIHTLNYQPVLIHVGQKLDIRIENEVRSILGNRFKSFPPNHSIEEFYWLSDVFLMASLVEGFPANTILEAMASSIPIICRKIEGYEDYLVNDYNSVIFNNEEEFKEGYNKIIRENEFADNISRNALKCIVQKHDIKIVSYNFYNFLKHQL